MIFPDNLFDKFVDISLGNHAGIVETFQDSEFQTGYRKDMLAYIHLFSQFPKEFKEIVGLILGIGFEDYLLVEHDHFRSLFIVIHNRQFFRDVERRKIEFKGFEASDIPVAFEKVTAMLFDDSPIEKVHNFFLTIYMVGILDEKDVFFEIF